ncbi:MAG TPA: hypothetical protein VFJ58_02010 [Armatimonadota bacterium]|nr:hypothetical protein [Armatimonadota bacterium]
MANSPMRILLTSFMPIMSLLLPPIIAAVPRAGAAPAPPTPQPQTLAAILTASRPPTAGIAFAVNADQVHLPAGAAPPPPNASLGSIADSFGRLVRQFGDVTALGPPTMVILNTHPVGGDILAGMAPSDAFRLFMASLTDEQWQAYASTAGLPLTALQNDWQRALIAAIFRNGSLKVDILPQTGSPKPGTPQELVITPAEIVQGRLRLTRKIQMFFKTTDPDPRWMGPGAPTLPDGSRLYEPIPEPAQPEESIDGEPIREETRNTPKRVDLNLNDRRFRTSIPLAGLKTAGDLIARIAKLTRTEIYIDRRSEGKPLTISGAASAPARDLLSALAFCLTGTYRNVGPAFVLTDDLMGVGTRQQILMEFEQSIKRERRKLLDRARKKGPGRSVEELPLRQDSVGLTPAQAQEAARQNPHAGAGQGLTVKLPLAQLTPAQQSAALQGMKDPFISADPGAPVELQDEPSLQLLLPGLDGAVNLSSYANIQSAFWAPPGPPDHEKPATAADEVKLISRYPHRPALITARTDADVASIVGSMRRLGLTELWLKVFGPDVPEKSNAAGLDGNDLLAAALKDTKDTGIAVLPLLDLLSWRPDTGRDSEDLNILGENSLELEARLSPIRRNRTGESLLLPELGLRVSPFDPAVQTRLTDFIRKVAATPGIAGLVWENANPFGYDADGPQARDSDPTNFGFSMGYTTAARLAFLRLEHVDPVDLRPPYHAEFDTSLPEFDNSVMESAIETKWDAFRADEDESLMKRLLQTARNARPSGSAPLPLIIGVHSFYYFTWDNIAVPLRSKIVLTAPNLADMFRRIKAHSRVALSAIGISWWRHGELFRDYQSALLKDIPWDGVVLDCVPSGTLDLEFALGAAPAPGQTSATLLARLAVEAGPVSPTGAPIRSPDAQARAAK